MAPITRAASASVALRLPSSVISAMELGIREAHALVDDGHEHVAAAVGHVVETGLHRANISRAIEDPVEHFSTADLVQSFPGVGIERQAEFGPPQAPAELEAVGAAIQHRDPGALERREQHDGDTNRACADDQHSIAGPDPGPIHGVRTDRQEFHHRYLVESQSVGFADEPVGHRNEFRHPAVSMNTQHLEMAAAVAPAILAGAAAVTRQVGHREHGLAGLQVRSGRRFDDLAREFMAHHARVGEERLRTPQDVHVGSAHTHATHA